jgi:hypothetical protein|tara:strand:+ start:2523 stop:2795 length:273 start_codon:yes stop_codon:yes gene_type:complete
MTKTEFLLELTDIATQLDQLLERYGKREEIISLMLTGAIEETEDGDKYIKAVYGYNIYDENELEEILQFIRDSFKGDAGPDLGGFDVFLN